MPTILELLEKRGMEPRKVAATKGGEYVCPCPSCGGEDCFHAWPEQKDGQGSWWCRKSGKGGDCISFLMEIDGLPFREAARIMGKEIKGRRHVSTPRVPTQRQPRPLDVAPVDVPGGSWQDHARKFVAFSHDHLMQSPDQLAWLESRGISRQTAARFRLGWNPGERGGRDIYRPRTSWGLPDVIKENGQPKKLWIPTGLTIPIIDGYDVLQIRIRRPEGEPRYFVLPGSASDPMPMLSAPSCWPGRNQALIICESGLDAILLTQAVGDLAGVIAVGSAQAKPRDQRADRMVRDAAWVGLWLDNDEAGDVGTSWWLDTIPTAQDIRPAGGPKDPGDYLRDKGSVRDHIIGAIPPAWLVRRPGATVVDMGGGGIELAKGAGSQSRPSISPGVAKMGKLLERCNVVCRIGNGSISIDAFKRENGAWVADTTWAHEHWELSQEIWRLFWYDDDVFAFIENHPDHDRGVNGKNFWRGVAGK
jgi:hypothetical protein